MIRPERERQPPMGVPVPSDIELPMEPVPLECPYPDDGFNDVDEYNDLIIH
jgi:hypothetical protein